jgi:uncharacterized protein
MKLHLTRSEGRNLFTGYGEGYVSINDERHQHNLVVAPDQPVQQWEAESFDVLKPEHLRAAFELKPEILILGTGPKQRFPDREIMRVIADAAIGFEVMDTKAACRTYNILMAEGRQVVAAIFVQ